MIYSLMILFFSYFWVATQFNEIQIADDLKKNGGYIPGVRPGQGTSDFLHNAMSRITLAGAVFLTVIATIPIIMSRQMGIDQNVASFFGGTSILIAVGVLLDTMRQMESHLLMRHYDGFLKKGRVRGPVLSRWAWRPMVCHKHLGARILWLELKSKSEEDLKSMRPAGVVAATVLDDIAAFIQPGITTRQVDEFAGGTDSRLRRQERVSRVPLGNAGVPPFPCHTCLSVNEEVVHGLAGPATDLWRHCQRGRGGQL